MFYDFTHNPKFKVNVIKLHHKFKKNIYNQCLNIKPLKSKSKNGGQLRTFPNMQKQFY